VGRCYNYMGVDMGKVVIVVLMCLGLVGCSEPTLQSDVKSYSNKHCGEGKLDIINSEKGIIRTPNGDKFTILTTQRGGLNNNIKGSFSYNERTEQLFIFQDREPYIEVGLEFLGEMDRDLIPSIAYKVEELCED